MTTLDIVILSILGTAFLGCCIGMILFPETRDEGPGEIR